MSQVLTRRSSSSDLAGRVVVGPEVVWLQKPARPRRPRPSASAEPQRSGEPVGRGAASGESTVARRVLVVDDEASVRMLCSFNLLAAGMDVREAVDGREALALIREEVPDLVLLDVMMPAVDGWELARELQRDPRTRHVPIVFLTARVEPADRRRAADLGAVGYVSKPFDPLELPALIERILDQVVRGERAALRQAVREDSDDRA